MQSQHLLQNYFKLLVFILFPFYVGKRNVEILKIQYRRILKQFEKFQLIYGRFIENN